MAKKPSTAKKPTPKRTGKKSSPINDELVRQLADLLEETNLAEIEYGEKDWHVRVSRGGGGMVSVQPQPTPAPPSPPPPPAESTQPAAAEDLSKHPGAVLSPMVGVVYLRPEPGAQTFVNVGDQVSEGDTVLLVEAMKVFNPITAGRSGKVTQVLVSDESPVEYGEPLIIIE